MIYEYFKYLCTKVLLLITPKQEYFEPAQKDIQEYAQILWNLRIKKVRYICYLLARKIHTWYLVKTFSNTSGIELYLLYIYLYIYISFIWYTYGTWASKDIYMVPVGVFMPKDTCMVPGNLIFQKDTHMVPFLAKFRQVPPRCRYYFSVGCNYPLAMCD